MNVQGKLNKSVYFDPEQKPGRSFPILRRGRMADSSGFGSAAPGSLQ